jgi:hypothetical protein
LKTSELRDISRSENAFSDPLPCVDADEIAFAMALFVSAANGRIHASNIGVSGFPVEENLFELIDAPEADEEQSPDTPSEKTDFAPLSRAVSVLWHHYKGDERQRTIWCRVVAFHAMMVKTDGSVVQKWTVQHDNDSSITSLHAAVVNAVAEAPLAEFGEFDQSSFVLCAERFEVEGALLTSTNLTVPLSTHSPNAHASAVLSRLRAPLSVLTGSMGLKALISRAIVTNCASHPWLKSAEITEEGVMVAVSSGSKPSQEELAQGEAAVTSSLLRSLRAMVGEGVAANLLGSVFDGEATLPG